MSDTIRTEPESRADRIRKVNQMRREARRAFERHEYFQACFWKEEADTLDRSMGEPLPDEVPCLFPPYFIP